MSIEEKLKDYNKIINEAWQILKKYAVVQMDKDVCEKIIAETNEIYDSHNKSLFACEILGAIINELERISKCDQKK